MGSRPIDPNQRIRIFKHRDETEVSKYCENSKEMTLFSDVLCVSRPCVLNACLAKAKNKYTKVGKRCLNLNREANYRSQSAFDDRTEEGISVVMFAFLSTIFSLGFLLLFIAQ